MKTLQVSKRYIIYRRIEDGSTAIDCLNVSIHCKFLFESCYYVHKVHTTI